jgi:Icc-related predicted phosphoesterase
LREWVERAQPAYLFCGHIHETAGFVDRLGATQCFNVGKQGYTMEI